MFEKANIEKIWEQFKDKQLSLSGVQKEIDKLFLVQKGFFKRLEDNLTITVNDRIYSETQGYLRTTAYLGKLKDTRKELIQESNWVDFWLSCPWLSAPTSEDVKAARLLSDSQLMDYKILFHESLIQMRESNLGNCLEASLLKSYFLLASLELKARKEIKKMNS